MDHVDLAVALDADGLLLAPNYRAEEEALRIMARMASKVRGGSGSRLVVQTAQPGHRIIRALRGGRGDEVMHEIVADRTEEGFPPSRDLLAIEIVGDRAIVSKDLDTLPGDVDVLGPAQGKGRWRWLVQADDLKATRVQLRTFVQRWRDEGCKVRIDVDPIDL
jgi:primosomal protein N'